MDNAELLKVTVVQVATLMAKLSSHDKLLKVIPVHPSEPRAGTIEENDDHVSLFLPSYQVAEATSRPFVFYWRNGKHETLYGSTVEGAFSTKYGRGAMPALDFFTDYGPDIQYTWNPETREWDNNHA